MLRLRVLDLLEERGHSKYWLFMRMELSYRNFDNLIKNRTSGIRFENLEKLCYFLECEPDDLFEIIPDDKPADPAEYVGKATRAARSGTRSRSSRKKKAADTQTDAALSKESSGPDGKSPLTDAAGQGDPDNLTEAAGPESKKIRDINIWKND